MKITICGSITLADKIIDISKQLEKLGHKIEIPHSVVNIRDGKISLQKYIKDKEKHGGDYFHRKSAAVDFIKEYYKIIKNSDSILVVNFDKNGIKNYIGGNALMELGFAYVLNKPIYLYNPIPKMSYTDEILAVKPMVIDGDLTKVKQQ